MHLSYNTPVAHYDTQPGNKVGLLYSSQAERRQHFLNQEPISLLLISRIDPKSYKLHSNRKLT